MTAGTAPGGIRANEQRVLDLLDEHAVVDLTLRLVACDSTNPPGTEATTVAELEKACAGAGMAVRTDEVAPGRPNLVAVYGDPSRSDSKPGLLFLGHSDVVPAGPGWSRDPFDPVVRDGRIIGRGVADMKGGVAAVVAAVDAVRRAGVELRGPVALACTVDEEDLDTGIRHLVAEPSILPGRYAGCVVAEPTSLHVIVACRGDAYLEIDVTGVPAHSGRPSDGRSAIDAASRIIALLREDHEWMGRDPDPLLGSGSWNVGRIEGGRGTSIVAPDAHLWVDRRLMPGDDPHEIAHRLRRSVADAGIDGDGIGVAVEVSMCMPGFRTDPGEAIVERSLEAAHDLGLASEAGGWTAACDGGFVVRELGIPTVVLGPGNIHEQAHQVDESIEVVELVAAARLYATLIVRMVS